MDLEAEKVKQAAEAQPVGTVALEKMENAAKTGNKVVVATVVRQDARVKKAKEGLPDVLDATEKTERLVAPVNAVPLVVLDATEKMATVEKMDATVAPANAVPGAFKAVLAKMDAMEKTDAQVAPGSAVPQVVLAREVQLVRVDVQDLEDIPAPLVVQVAPEKEGLPDVSDREVARVRTVAQEAAEKMARKVVTDAPVRAVLVGVLVPWVLEVVQEKTDFADAMESAERRVARVKMGAKVRRARKAETDVKVKKVPKVRRAVKVQ